MLTTRQSGLVIGALAAAAGIVFAFVLVGPNPPAGDAPSSRGGEPELRRGDVTTLAASPHLLFRHTNIDANYNYVSVVALADIAGSRGMTALQCERVSFAAARGICLKADRGVFTTYEAVLFDDRFRPLRSLKLDGRPSRTRLSRDGRFGAITVFVSSAGHGYASLSSLVTKTIIVDMASGGVLGDLEQFTTWRKGERFSSKDFNFWGVTFADDGNTFYATLQSGKKTFLVRGDVGHRRLTVLHENVECPSLSPDNRLIAYKKRVGPEVAPWRFHVLDLATMTERPIAAETRSIDDQIEWFDADHVLYATQRPSQPATLDVWIARVDADEPARRFLPMADSPALVR